MSNFYRPWNTNNEDQEQEKVTPKRSLFDNLSDTLTAIGANYTDVRATGDMGDLRHQLFDPDENLTEEEYYNRKAEYQRLRDERQQARDTYKTAHNNLVADNSFFKNVDQLGGTLEGMAAQGIGTAVGAGLGFLSPVVGGTAMGAKVGNAAGAVAGGYLDARSVALQAEEDVLNNGGTWEQAKRAYDETLKKASLTTLPETLVDIAMGNRLVGSALNSRAARKIAGSTLGRMGSSVLDPAAKIGTQAAFKSGSTLVGRGAGILADTALQGSTEALQEVTQDYIGNREVAKAMGKTDNEYSLGGFKDFALSDQGLETMKTAGIMGALFGGVGGTLSSGQYLTRGAETNTGIRAHNNTEKMINDGTLKIDKERRQDEEKIISALTGISPAELATWSDADIVAEASILEGQYMGVIGEAEDMSTTRGAADVVRRLTSKEDNTIHREGDVTETSRAFLKGMGVDDKMLEGMFNSPVEKSIIEKARREEEQAARQEKTGEKQQTTARLTDKTGQSMRENEGKSAIENIKEEAQQNKAETTTEKTPSNNLGSAAKQQEQQGKIDTSDNIEYKDSLPGDWEADTQEFEKDAMLDQQSYRNTNTNKKAVIARATDGGFNVVTDLNEERGDTPHFDTLEAAENYLTGKQDDINFQETNSEQTKEGTTEDPNIVPEGGVDARGNSHSGELINSVDDLFNFRQQNPGIIGRGEFIEFVHAKHNLGVNDLNMYLDRKNEGRVYNEQTGQWGYVNAKKFHDEATGRAMIQLYRGGDIISAVHEIAHIGYENLSVQDKATFNRYAVKSMGQWIADMLDVNYDDALRQRLHNLQNDEELRKKIEDSPALRQTVIAFLNAEQNGVNLNHLTADQIRAIDERWAWEFSMWYTEGYMRGVEPQNILQRIYQRGIFSLGRELNMLNRLWEHIHHKDNQDIENLYTGRRNQTEEQVAQEEEIINPFEAPPVTPQQTQQAAPIVTPVEQTVQQQAPVTPPVEQAQAPVPQEQPQVVQTQTQTEPVQEKPKNNKRQKQPKQPKEPQMTEQELNEQKWRVETGKFLKQFEGAKPKQIEQSDADRLNGIINQIKEHPELDKSKKISERIQSILKKFSNQNVQPAQQEQTQEQVQEKPQTAEQTTPVTKAPSVQQPEQSTQQRENGAGLVTAQNLTNQNKNATVKQKQEVANNGKAEDTRGTENLRTNVGEVQGGRSVRQGNDNRTGEGRVGQNAVEGRSEGNGENLSLLKNSKFKSVYNARKEKKTELKDWRDLSGDDKLKQVFVDALNKSKEADSQHGVYVDSKTVEELKDCKVILHKNKMAGFAITSDGNIVGVFSNPKNPIRGILNDMIFIAHMMGGNRMDCFGKFLLRGYRNSGFTPVARTSFAEEYYPADNPANATIRKEKPDVYFLVKDNDNNNTYLNKVENDVYMNDAIDADSVYHIDSEDSYGDALGFQGQVLEEIQKKENKNKSTKEVADSLRPKEETATETQEITETQEQNASIEEESPSTTEEQTEQNQASEERKEDLLNYTNYPEEFATREEALKSVDDEKVLNEKDKQEVIDYINEWYDEIEGKQKPETTENQVEEEQKPKQEQTTKEEETSEIEKKIGEMLESRRKQREEKGLEEESPEQIKEIREQYRKFFMLSNQNKTTKGKTTKTNKTTKPKTKQTDPLSELHKKYKNITGTPIGEKGYRFKDDGTRFMFGAAGAKNQTILNTNKEKQFEQHFRTHMKLRGFSEKFIDDYFSNNKNGEEQIIDDDKLQQKSLFNKTFIDTFNEYNNMMQKKAGVKRGLDGRWRFEFSDKDSHFDKNSLSNNFLDMVTNLPKQKGMAGKLSGKLQDVFDHKLLYKYYPQFKELKISFCTADYFKKTGLDLNVVGAYNNGEILINIDYLKKQKTIKAREVEVKQTILHEIQHAIQDYEGLAEGAGSTSFERQLRQRKLVDSYIKKLGGQKEAGQKLLNAINDVIKNIKKVPRNKRGDLYKKIRNNAEYFNDTEQNFVLKNPRAIIEGYMNNYQDVNKKYGRYFDNEVKEMCEYLSLSKDLGLNRELLRPIDQYQKLYWTHLGEIEARQTEQRMDMTDEERLKRTDVLDEGIKNLDILKDAPLVIKRTVEYSPNSNDAPLFQEANPPKNKKMTDEEREEKEYNKRKERVEKAKEEGTLSDQMKDVYSVSFTKSAQEYAENRTKMEYFDNNEDYWDRTEDKSTGKVTYVRKTPYEHQQKVVTYNGVNDVKRENKKKSKPVQWMEWMKDQLIKYMFNDKHYLAKAARKLGVYDAYRRMIVTEGYALKANTALTQGIKYNGKTTRALNDIIRDVGEPKQKEFLKYCIAHRILDLKDRENPVFQKMKPDEARRYIEEIKASPDAELFERNRKDFVEYNKALLHVLVDGGIMDEKTFQKFCEVDPNFVPLTKVMDDADIGFSSIINAHNLVNLKSPIKKIGTSMLEIANPFLEMQKRTAEYYAIASRNKAGQIFVNEIAGALEKTTGGDVIARGQGMLRRVRVDERNGQLITKPDDKQQIIYVCNNGKHEFYQVADKEIYQALTFMNADQMGTIHKMLDKIAHVPSGLVRETATMVPDFGVRNVIRDGGEAFLTSEHGFIPVIDQIWGMWQVMNNTEWAQMYFNQNGEYGTLNRDKVNSEGIASVDDVIDEKLNPLKNFKEIKQAQMAILKDKQRQFSILTDIKDGNFGDAWEHARKSRGVAALKLAISPLWAIGKSNKRMNDLFELGTRVGEFKNAKMGFEGTLDRMARGIMNTNLKEAEFQKKAQSDVYAAHVAKDITLNFSQHGKLGKELNRYIPFFNASLQGIYKLCNTLETMVTGTTISGGKNRRLQQELLFKAALVTAMAVGVAAAGDGDEDYEEAPDYEKENFWILPNGLRFPKDQVLGKIIGNTVEKSYAQWKKGKAEPSTILKSILENFKPDRFMFAIFDLAIGGFGNYDTFKERSIVPEYMADKLGHLQKDISTSNFAVDVSEALWKCGFDISAKKIDWALQKNFSNCAKYATAIYDLGKKTFNPKEFNERIARGYDKNDSTGSMVAGLKDDIPSPINLVSGTFATNRSTFKSISDFYENYKKYKKLSSDEASMSKEDKRRWKRYEQAYKKDMTFRKQLRAIKQDRTLTGKQKREKADKIFKQQIKLAKWAEG